MKPTIYIFMGVSAFGKTTMAQKLAAYCDIPYIEADDFHPESNKQKMANGIPLTDSDRFPWLHRLHAAIKKQLTSQVSATLACSALKEEYRTILMEDISDAVQLIYLKGSFEVLQERIQNRNHDYMPASLLESQFEALEEPKEAITIDVSKSVEANFKELLAKLSI